MEILYSLQTTNAFPIKFNKANVIYVFLFKNIIAIAICLSHIISEDLIGEIRFINKYILCRSSQRCTKKHHE